MLACAVEGCYLRCKHLFELVFSYTRASQVPKTSRNVEESVGSERPVHSDIGKHKPREPSDALAAHLCSEIAQGPVKLDPHLVVFHQFLPAGEPLKEGETA